MSSGITSTRGFALATMIFDGVFAALSLLTLVVTLWLDGVDWRVLLYGALFVGFTVAAVTSAQQWRSMAPERGSASHR
jgi:hypothetical protein